MLKMIIIGTVSLVALLLIVGAILPAKSELRHEIRITEVFQNLKKYAESRK